MLDFMNVVSLYITAPHDPHEADVTRDGGSWRIDALTAHKEMKAVKAEGPRLAPWTFL